MYRYMKHLIKPTQLTNFQSASYCIKVESIEVDVKKDFCASSIAEPPLLPAPKYGGENFVTLITGSTLIGEQGASYIKTLFNAAKVPVYLEHIPVGNNMEFLTSVIRNRNAVHVDLQHDPETKAKLLRLNSSLGLWACIVKMQSYEGFKCKYPNLKITVITQNISGDFSKLEYEPVPGIVETLKFYQDKDIKHYLTFVFRYAMKNQHKKITFALQLQELPLSDGMFMKIACEMQRSSYPSIEIEYMPVNKVIRFLIMAPQIFDMICTNDRYGTFVASICASVCGGASLFAACEIGDYHAVFKPLQTKLSISDCRTLSPYGVVRASIELLLHLGNTKCAKKLEESMMTAMLEHCVKTPEFGGTDDGDYVICHIVNILKSC